MDSTKSIKVSEALRQFFCHFKFNVMYNSCILIDDRSRE